MLGLVTLTGIDERTDPDEIIELKQEYPFLEFGVLISEDRTGKENRYPRLETLKKYDGKELDLSLHVCGSMARNVAHNADWRPLYEMAQEYWHMFNRIQLNISNIASLNKGKGFSKEIKFIKHKRFIIQISPDSSAIYNFYKKRTNVAGFQDGSGGLGISPDAWLPSDEPFFGYGGGLGPDNVEREIQKIMEINKNPFWIDMEAKLRTDDWLDIKKCRRVAEICACYVIHRYDLAKSP